MRKILYMVTLVALLLGALAAVALADGTETLGPPSIPIAAGSGIAIGGVGLAHAQPGVINVDVPAGAVVNQVIVYWSGEFRTVSDSEILVAGNPVAGTSIGGPTVFYDFGGPVSFESYRADITGLGLIGPGLNAVSVEGMAFDADNGGVGILVIYQEADAVSEIAVVDGNDLAYYEFVPPLDTTVAQTFNFAAADADRVADLAIFAASVGGANRPNAIEVTVGGVTTSLPNLLGSFDGSYWDSLLLPVSIPAGATSVTVQVLSQSDGTANKPASLNWVGATLSVPVPEEDLGEGCTPGYWRQEHHYDDWAATGLSPADSFNATFGVDYFDNAYTLGEAAWARGGSLGKVARHGTAALLNALHPDVDFQISAADVIAAVQSGNVDYLVAFNELETPGFCD